MQILLSESIVLESKKETQVLNQQYIQKSFRSIAFLRIPLQLAKILNFVARILSRNQVMLPQIEPEGNWRLGYIQLLVVRCPRNLSHVLQRSNGMGLRLRVQPTSRM